MANPLTELDIWRAANLLIQQHADGAEEEAARLAYVMVRRGDPEGERVWLRIKRAIAELQAPPKGPAH